MTREQILALAREHQLGFNCNDDLIAFFCAAQDLALEDAARIADKVIGRGSRYGAMVASQIRARKGE